MCVKQWSWATKRKSAFQKWISILQCNVTGVATSWMVQQVPAFSETETGLVAPAVTWSNHPGWHLLGKGGKGLLSRVLDQQRRQRANMLHKLHAAQWPLSKAKEMICYVKSVSQDDCVGHPERDQLLINPALSCMHNCFRACSVADPVGNQLPQIKVIPNYWTELLCG